MISAASLCHPATAAWAAALTLALAATSAHAEDPLLGRIKVIQCVGCTPGSVDLVLHDPIDVRDFQVRINESDYQKIITPLAGKTVYDKEGCFYWFDAPKGGVKPAPAESPKETGKPVKPVKPGKATKKGAKGSTDDSAEKADAGTPTDGVMETSAPPPTPEEQGTPSKCIPFTRVEVKPAHPGKKED